MISSVPLGLLVMDSRVFKWSSVASPHILCNIALPLCMSVAGIDEERASDIPSSASVERLMSSF